MDSNLCIKSLCFMAFVSYRESYRITQRCSKKIFCKVSLFQRIYQFRFKMVGGITLVVIITTVIIFVVLHVYALITSGKKIFCANHQQQSYSYHSKFYLIFIRLLQPFCFYLLTKKNDLQVITHSFHIYISKHMILNEKGCQNMKHYPLFINCTSRIILDKHYPIKMLHRKPKCTLTNDTKCISSVTKWDKQERMVCIRIENPSLIDIAQNRQIHYFMIQNVLRIVISEMKKSLISRGDFISITYSLEQ